MRNSPLLCGVNDHGGRIMSLISSMTMQSCLNLETSDAYKIHGVLIQLSLLAHFLHPLGLGNRWSSLFALYGFYQKGLFFWLEGGNLIGRVQKKYLLLLNRFDYKREFPSVSGKRNLEGMVFVREG